MNDRLFGGLIRYVERADQPFASSEQPRWIKRKSIADSVLMTRADVIASFRLTRFIRGVQIEHGGKVYHAIIGLPLKDVLLPKGIILEELTPGLFIISILEGDIPLAASPLQVKESIEDMHQGVDGFDGIDLASLAALYPDIYVVLSDQNYVYSSDLIRVIGVLTCLSYRDGPIYLEEETLLEIQSLFDSGSENIPFANILQGLVSISWNGLFLELYRSVEQLFSVPKLMSITEIWPATMPYVELAELLESRISWRPKESEALSAIIRECGESVRSSISSAFCKRRQPPVDHQNMADDVYRLRNGIVHFRKHLAQGMISDEDWNEIIRAMVGLIREVYEIYGDRYYRLT